MEDLKDLMRHNYITYASYVILDRAIPHILDGLKPVQRRILHTLFTMDDGKFHKVANIVGQTMAFHPHGDAAIYEALVNLANKGFLLSRQGNFGNIFTGDPAAAARYIEARLSPLAREALFNPNTTKTTPSYDGRNQEPICLPAKIPLLLMQGAEGIAVGMTTKVLSHNFIELLEAEIEILDDKEITLLPDFPTGGILDASEYDKGRGKIKLRARITTPTEKTVVITEICHGTSTESLIRSIDEAAKKGKIKIDRIDDYTAEKVEIEITLPRGHYAKDLIKKLYAFTQCEVTIHSQVTIIKDNKPYETDVEDILRTNVHHLRDLLRQELEIEKAALTQKIFEKTLEQIFIEHKIYKVLEKVSSQKGLTEKIAENLIPYYDMLSSEPTTDDITKLLSIPIRRISRFDIDKNLRDIAALHEAIKVVDRKLKNMKKTTTSYLKKLIDTYSDAFPRKTTIEAIEELNVKALAVQNVKVGFDADKGYIGTKVPGVKRFECSNYDKILLILDNGTFTVINIPEKEYVHNNGKVLFVGIADKKTVFRVLYRDKKTNYCYAKRFVVSKFIIGKEYAYIDKDSKLELLSTESNKVVNISFKPKARQKVSKLSYNLDSVAIKGVTAKGIRIATKELRKVYHKQKEPDLFDM
jgi:topoisomerase IV subunit A